MSKTLLLIINPAAGRGSYKVNLGEALHVLARGGYITTVRFTTARGDAMEIAAREGENYDVAACVGGDGTLSEMLTGLMCLKNPPRVGYIPMGTANDVATTLGLPKNDTVGAANRIVNGQPHPFDLGGFGDNGIFAYIAAFGAFTEVSYATPQNQKESLGKLAYVLQGALQLPKIEPIRARVEYDGGVIEDNFIYGSMSNSTSIAGLVRIKEDLVSLGDGMSELVLVKNPATVEDLRNIVTGVVAQRYDHEQLLILKTKRAKFTFEKPIAWTRDGEEGGNYKEIELVNYAAPVEFIF